MVVCVYLNVARESFGQGQMLLSLLSFDFISPLCVWLTCDKTLGRRIPLCKVLAKPSPARADLHVAPVRCPLVVSLSYLHHLPQYYLPKAAYVA